MGVKNVLLFSIFLLGTMEGIASSNSEYFRQAMKILKEHDNDQYLNPRHIKGYICSTRLGVSEMTLMVQRPNNEKFSVIQSHWSTHSDTDLSLFCSAEMKRNLSLVHRAKDQFRYLELHWDSLLGIFIFKISNKSLSEEVNND